MNYCVLIIKDIELILNKSYQFKSNMQILQRNLIFLKRSILTYRFVTDSLYDYNARSKYQKKIYIFYEITAYILEGIHNYYICMNKYKFNMEKSIFI